MIETVITCTTYDELAAFVHRQLCQLDSLEEAQTPLFQTPLTRASRTSAVLFHIDGPRLLRTSAIWSIDEHKIHIYNSQGTKTQTIRLSEAPELPTDSFVGLLPTQQASRSKAA